MPADPEKEGTYPAPPGRAGDLRAQGAGGAGDLTSLNRVTVAAAVQDQSIFLVREVVGELLTGRTNVNVPLSHIAEILLAEATFRLRIRCLRFWQRDRDAGLFACEDLLAFEVAAIGESFEASASNAAFAWLAMFASCDLSVPTLVTSCATIRWFV